MDLALNNLQWLICHKTQATNQKLYIAVGACVQCFFFISFFKKLLPCESVDCTRFPSNIFTLNVNELTVNDPDNGIGEPILNLL